MKKLRQFCLTILLLSVFSITSNAQFGDGSDGALITSSTVYTDDVRSRVTHYISNYTGSGPYTITVTITTTDDLTTDLSVGDLLIVVNMSQWGRNYDLITVNSLSSYSIQGTAARTDYFAPNVNLGYLNYCQVIRVPQYSSITLNSGGELTCHPYSDLTRTGGICAFLCDGTLDFNGGKIDTKEKGQQGRTAGVGGGPAPGVDPSLVGTSGTSFGAAGTD